MLAAASNDTHVRLVTPMLHVQRKDAGSKLHLACACPAPTPTPACASARQPHDRTRHDEQRRPLLDTMASPIAKGNLRAIATVAGADTAISNPIPFTLVS